MSSAKERRLRTLELRLGMGPKEELPIIFMDGVMYKDEPDDLIIGATMNETAWERNSGESVSEFKERICQEIKKMPEGTIRSVWLKKDYTGLPEPSTEMPAFTPYAEVIERIKSLNKKDS